MNPQIEELACLYVLDRLDWQERAVFESRLPQEPELAALVRELESSLSRRVHALPQLEAPPGLLAAIEARIGRQGSSTTAPHALPWAAAARWGIAAVIAIGVGILAVQSLRRPQAAAARPYVLVVGLDSAGSRITELAVKERPKNADADFIQLASLAEKYWEKPQELPVGAAPAGGGERGYALFDPASSQGFIAIRQLPAVGAGKQYRLWLVDTATGRIRSAGVLPSGAPESGLYFFSVAPGSEKADRLDFFVTAEDASAADPAQPHGKVVLGDRRI
jgi:anti-sigma-K factor RskA